MKGIIASCKRDRTGVKLEDGSWYSSRNRLADNLNRGTEVEFEYTTNESNGRIYNNITDGTFKILKEASFNGGAKGGFRKSDNSGGFKKNDNFEAGVTAGAALNNAILLAAHGKIDMADIKDKALGIAKLSIELKKQVAAMLAHAPAPQQQAQQPVQQPVSEPKPAPQSSQPQYDDDIPF